MTAGTRPAPDGWDIDDPVTRLRVWGDDRAYPIDGASNWTIGTADTCGISVVDATGRASRRHAELVRDGGWLVRDLGSTNGTTCDGDPRATFQITPGVEIGIGGVTLIAESRRLRELHAYLSRLIGWSSDRFAMVDRALRAVREMATRRAALVIAGEGDLVPFARWLHDRALPINSAFMVAGANGGPIAGTLCVVEQQRPRDLVPAIAQALRPDSYTRVIVCCAALTDAADIAMLLGRSSSIEIPPVATRGHEIERLLVEYAEDAARELGAAGRAFRDNEMRWLGALVYASLADVTETARRVVALRNFGVSAGATRLGISHAAMSRWAKRRHIPT